VLGGGETEEGGAKQRTTREQGSTEVVRGAARDQRRAWQRRKRPIERRGVERPLLRPGHGGGGAPDPWPLGGAGRRDLPPSLPLPAVVGELRALRAVSSTLARTPLPVSSSSTALRRARAESLPAATELRRPPSSREQGQGWTSSASRAGATDGHHYREARLLGSAQVLFSGLRHLQLLARIYSGGEASPHQR
jgi:hypothetical protein